jgi:hypothetical protein
MLQQPEQPDLQAQPQQPTTKKKNKLLEYQYLNNLLNTNNQIEDMIRFLRSRKRTYPEGVDKVKYKEKSKMFKTVNGNLVYAPLNLRYVLQPNINEVLEGIYGDQTLSLGRGVESFYKYVRSRYIGITRREVSDFLKSKKTFNLTRPKKSNSKYSLATYSAPRQAFAIDLIDMGKILLNPAGYRYIMNVMDLFSKYVFLRPLREKDALTTSQAFRNEIINEGLKPKVLISDNGNEWEGEFAEMLREQDIKHIHNPAHFPVPTIEAMNGNVRRLLKDMFVRQGNTEWYNKLGTIQNSLNNYYSRRNGNHTPATLFEIPVIEGQPKHPILKEVEKRTKESKTYKRRTPVRFAVGQPVHVSLIALDNNIAEKNKNKELKNVQVLWTPQIFFVKEVLPLPRTVGNHRYIIWDANQRILANDSGASKIFKESDLIDASKEIQPQNELTYAQMMERLNKIKRPKPLKFKD